jgi:spore photoproduct lyase
MTIARIVADKRLTDLTLAGKAATRYGLPIERLTKDELVAEITALPLEERYRRAKRTLFFTTRKGPFLSTCRCPSGADYRCCGYHTIQSVSGCPFDCSYCILQHYIGNNPFISVFTDRDAVEAELRAHLENHRHIRVGTGELADSLALDDLLDESGFFLSMIARNGWEKRITFEFKTKSDRVDTLIAAHEQYPAVDCVAGFTLTLDRFHATDEIGTAPTAARLAAAARCAAVGVRVAFHFDPLVMQERFLDDYRTLAVQALGAVTHEKIAWISLGGLRHTVSMTELIRRRWPDSALTLGEMFPSADDHKLRPFAPLRRRFYRALRDEITGRFPAAPLYLCMEKDFMWEQTGITPPRFF